MNVGVITYDARHLKTEQVVLQYVDNYLIESITLFALPFVDRPQRDVVIRHRPHMLSGVHPSALQVFEKVSYESWDGNSKLGDRCDFFVVCGAGLLDIGFAEGKPIFNLHPGIIPLSRGLDSFKWAILGGDPIGNTLHLIDHEVDMGKIILIKKTPVLPGDNLIRLARRHYEAEIAILGGLMNYIDGEERVLFPPKPPKKRMKKEDEEKVVQCFESWKSKFICKTAQVE